MTQGCDDVDTDDLKSARNVYVYVFRRSVRRQGLTKVWTLKGG